MPLFSRRPAGEAARSCSGPHAPDAVRARRPGWRDPRIVVGVLVVAACVLLGARLFAAADDTLPVWVLTRDVPAGTPLTADAVSIRRVHFGDSSTADLYLLGSRPAPEGFTVDRDLSAGELLPRTALGARDSGRLVEVPLSVPPDALPATVRRGSRVDVWTSPDPAAGGTAGEGSERVLQDVVVLDVPDVADSFGPQETRQVIVGVPRQLDLTRTVDRLATGRLLVTRKG